MPRPDPLALAIERALAGAGRAAEAERAQALASADIPGTLAGLGGTTLYNVPLSEAERQANAIQARRREAARPPRTVVALPEMVRELGDIASMYGLPSLERAADVASVATPDIEYDPVALASSFNPLSDEIIAGVEALSGRRLGADGTIEPSGGGYRARQAELEQRFERAQEESPWSAGLGALGSLAVTGPLIPALNARRAAVIGGTLGTAGGYLGSEGEDATDRALSTLGGGIMGGTVGGIAGGLSSLGNAMRAGSEAGTLGGAGRYMLGSVGEGVGQGMGYGALSSGGTVGDGLIDVGAPNVTNVPISALSGLSLSDLLPSVRLGELGRDIAIGGGIGGVASVPFGAVGGAFRAARPAAVAGADDLATLARGADIDETALIGGLEPDRPETMISRLLGTSSQQIADARRLRAAGALDRGVRDRIVASFNPGDARAGLRTAARVARESGISPADDPFWTLDQAAEAAERARVTEGAHIGRMYEDIAGTGAVMRGDVPAAALEAEANRLAQQNPDRYGRRQIQQLRDRATEARFGSLAGEFTPRNRLEYERLSRMPALTPDEEAAIGLREADIADDLLPNVREVTAYPPRLAVPPQTMPFEQGVARTSTVGEQLRAAGRPGAPPALTPREVLAIEHRALVGERRAAERLGLGSERYEREMVPANLTFRLASELSPASRLGNVARASDEVLTPALAMYANGGPLNPRGFISGMIEKGYRQRAPAISAYLAERAAAPGGLQLRPPEALSRLSEGLSGLGLRAPEPGMMARSASAAGIGSLSPSETVTETAADGGEYVVDDPDYDPMARYRTPAAAESDSEYQAEDPDYDPMARYRRERTDDR